MFLQAVERIICKYCGFGQCTRNAGSGQAAQMGRTVVVTEVHGQ